MPLRKNTSGARDGISQEQAMLEMLSNSLPAITSISPITVAGVGVSALAALIYLFTRLPEMLLVIATAVIYAAVPLLPRLF
jgi:hypothetical protein